MKKFIAIVMSALSLCSMAGISANAEEYNESQIDIMEGEYTNTYDENSDIVDRSVNYDLVSKTCNFSFIDNAWSDDSNTYSAEAYTNSGLYIGTAYCEYNDNVGTDKVQGSYYSGDYYHYCCTISQGVSSYLSGTVAPYETAYNSWIDYGSGANVEVKCFAQT